MITGFRHKGLKLLFDTGSTKGINVAHKVKLLSILAALDVAARPDELILPSYRLHPLKGAMKGHWSIWVNGNWRVTFRFAGSDVELVDYQDYH
jgi:proteic killer suppression protein